MEYKRINRELSLGKIVKKIEILDEMAYVIFDDNTYVVLGADYDSRNEEVSIGEFKEVDTLSVTDKLNLSLITKDEYTSLLAEAKTTVVMLVTEFPELKTLL